MASRVATTLKRTSMVDAVADALRTEILTGALSPGDRIRVKELEETFGVSHIPIREALRRLGAEGLVEMAPKGATLVSGISLEDLDGLYDLRRIVECEYARRAAPLFDERWLGKLDEAIAELDSRGGDTETPEFWEAHNRFHRALLEPALTGWAERVLNQIWQSSERYVRLFITTFGDQGIQMAEHHEMVAAARARDGDALARLLARHLSRTEETVREGYLALRAKQE
jgi:DNA-binding GntR family transcriptional regulator